MTQVTFKKREIVYRPYEPIVKTIVDLVMIICLAYLLVLAFAHKLTVDDSAMDATLNSEDTVLINKIAFSFRDPERFDLIVFTPQNAEEGELAVRRVIGLPGETVQIQEGRIYIDGKLLENDVIDTDIYNAGLAAEPIKLAYNEYFVLGDNRNNSDDSRFANIGLVKSDSIIGNPWFILSPITDFGPVTNSPKTVDETETATE